MNIQFAAYHVPRRLKELGYEECEYYSRLRHLILKGGETLEIDSFNQLYFLVEDVGEVCISSELGVYDLNAQNINEQKYEHQGQISIHNYSHKMRRVKLIQVIFKCK